MYQEGFLDDCPIHALICAYQSIRKVALCTSPLIDCRAVSFPFCFCSLSNFCSFAALFLLLLVPLLFHSVLFHSVLILLEKRSWKDSRRTPSPHLVDLFCLIFAFFLPFLLFLLLLFPLLLLSLLLLTLLLLLVSSPCLA